MDVKKILKDPQAYNASLGTPLTEQVYGELEDLQQQSQALAKQLKKTQADKGRVARLFKAANANAVQLDALKLQMHSISCTVRDTELAIAQIRLATTRLLQESAAATRTPLPSRFTRTLTHYGKSIAWRWLDDPQDPLWQNFVQQQADLASVYHLPVIHNTIQRAFGQRCKILLALDSGTVVGGLPVTLFRSRLFGRQAVSVGFFNYGGPLTAYRDIAEQLIAQSRNLVTTDALDQIEIRTTLAGLPFPCVDEKVSMIRRLPERDADLETELGAKVRAQVNKARAHKPAVRFGGAALLDDFYRVFAHNMRDLGTPVYSKVWFAQLLAARELKASLVVCYLDAKAVSVGFLLGYQEVLEIPWASTLRSVNGLNMNMWMYRQILAHAIAEGYGYFDFGRSSQDATTYRFKKQWGALPVAHYWYYPTTVGTASRRHSPDNPKLKLLIKLWQKLPVWLTKIIGPPIIKNIP